MIALWFYCGMQTLAQIRQDVGESPIWVSVDETTDATGRYVANVIVGKLDVGEAGKPHLISTRMLERTNNETIARTVNEALGKTRFTFTLVYLNAYNFMVFSRVHSFTSDHCTARLC